MAELAIGAAADDFTGATDLAGMFSRAGMRVLMAIGEPSGDLLAQHESDAIVVALKSRSIPAADAVDLAINAWKALSDAGAGQAYFKYCSTFDSTPAGNIGPVSEALASATGSAIVPHLPALPENGRAVYQGHLFVHGRLLNESGLEKHPLNPMTDPDLVRWLSKQATSKVGLVSWPTVTAGSATIGAALDQLAQDGCGHAIGDAIANEDLAAWGEALADSKLVAGGSGLAVPLALAHAERGRWTANKAQATLAPQAGSVLIVSGSCAPATLEQIDAFKADGGPALRIDPTELSESSTRASDATDLLRTHLSRGPTMVYTSGTPEQVQAAQAALGSEQASRLAEEALASIVSELVSDGSTSNVIAAGGETAGAVVSELGVAALRIGPEISPGVPWTEAMDRSGTPLGCLALKSGNFGSKDFFARACRMLAGA